MSLVGVLCGLVAGTRRIAMQEVLGIPGFKSWLGLKFTEFTDDSMPPQTMLLIMSVSHL